MMKFKNILRAAALVLVALAAVVAYSSVTTTSRRVVGTKVQAVSFSSADSPFSATWTPTKNVNVREIRFKSSASGSDTLLATLDSARGATWDCKLASVALSSTTSNTTQLASGVLAVGDSLVVTAPNASARTYSVDIIYDQFY